jgi:hypothetical protein
MPITEDVKGNIKSGVFLVVAKFPHLLEMDIKNLKERELSVE